MHPEWQQHLLQSGAQFGNGSVANFGDPGAELASALSGDILVDLSHLASIEVAGDDATTFLNGQLTSDVAGISADRCGLSAWCNAQGRALALFQLFRIGDAYALLFPAELADSTTKRLRMYVLRSKVTITDRSDEYTRLGVSGKAAASALANSIGVPDTDNGVIHHHGITVIRMPHAKSRFVLCGSVAPLVGIWQELIKTTRPAGRVAWDLLDVVSGLPQVFAATREKFVPLTLNLDSLGGIGFEKGCYTGQEIIARMKYRGHLKQRMFIGRADAAAVPAPGTRLAVEGLDMSAGEVVQAVPHPAGGIVMTAIAQIELDGADRVHLQDASGPLVRLSPPPYHVG